MILSEKGPPICGALHPMTKDGFVAMLREANDALTIGYELIGLFPIEKKMGVVYRKRTVGSPAPVESDRAVLVGQ